MGKTKAPAGNKKGQSQNINWKYIQIQSFFLCKLDTETYLKCISSKWKIMQQAFQNPNMDFWDFKFLVDLPCFSKSMSSFNS